MMFLMHPQPKLNLVLCCPLQAGACMCEEGFTEVLSPAGQLNQCAPIPILEIPTAGDKKGDVKTSRAINPTMPSTILPGRTGRTWYLQPYGPGQIYKNNDNTANPQYKRGEAFCCCRVKTFKPHVLTVKPLHCPGVKA